MSPSNPSPDETVASNPRLKGVNPTSLTVSEYHVRSREVDVGEDFVRNVKRVGLIQPPICRQSGGDVSIVDGVRRVKAAKRAGLDEIPVLVYDLTESEAVSVSLALNLSVWRKSVSEDDHEGALRSLVGGPRRPLNGWESDEEVFEAKSELGLVGEVDRMARFIGDVKGVGEASVLALTQEFDTPEAVREATVEDIKSTPGIGSVLAQRISEGTSRNEDSV